MKILLGCQSSGLLPNRPGGESVQLLSSADWETKELSTTARKSESLGANIRSAAVQCCV